jgi:molybdenum cofactor cytidylyltransferase
VKFGAVPLADALGAVLAHSVSVGTGRLRKGIVLTQADLDALAAAGARHVIVAQLSADDVAEDAAAAALAQALCGSGLELGHAGTGRANLYARHDGLLCFDSAMIDAVNAVDEALTVATLPCFSAVRARQMVATIKIIPYAAPAAALQRCLAVAAPVRVQPFALGQVDLLQTTLPGLKDSLHAKTIAVTRSRVDALGGTLRTAPPVPHDEAALAETLAQCDGDVVLIVGASAIADRDDVIPAAMRRAGGRVDRLGMPVDPGNLLCLGARADGRPVIGLPGCARSPKLNGLDWLLWRLAAGIAVTGADIVAMGVGGLLEETPDRPLPRAASAERSIPLSPQVGVLLLAAGASRRMGDEHKLLKLLHGVPLAAASAKALASAGDIIAVVGHRGADVAAALDGLVKHSVVNPRAAEGLSSSLQAGIAALPERWDGVFIHLADMPFVRAQTLATLRAAFAPERIIVPVHAGKRGHPVLWPRAHWPRFAALSGDSGAKAILDALSEAVIEVDVDDPGVLIDLDTPEAWAKAHIAEMPPST